MIIQKGLAAANEIFEQLDHEIETDEGNNETEISGHIEFRNVDFSYDKGGLVLNNINFEIDDNETIAIVGNQIWKINSCKPNTKILQPYFRRDTNR